MFVTALISDTKYKQIHEVTDEDDFYVESVEEQAEEINYNYSKYRIVRYPVSQL